MTAIDFGGYIKSERRQRNYTQAEMAKLASVSQRTYQRIEAGETKPTIDQMMRIMSSLRVNSIDFLNRLFKQSVNLSDHASNEMKFYEPFESIRLASESLVGFSNNDIRALRLMLKERRDAPNKVFGYWEWNVDNNNYFYSDEMMQLYGFTRETFSPTVYRSVIFEEDMRSIDQDLGNLLTFKVPYYNKHRIRRAGEVREIECWAKKIQLDNNESVIVGINEEA